MSARSAAWGGRPSRARRRAAKPKQCALVLSCNSKRVMSRVAMRHRLQSIQSRHPMREGIGAALFACALALSAMPAAAQSLNDALAGAYQTNPVLQAARAQLRATDELVPEALSGWRPTVTAEAGGGGGIDNNHDDGRLLGLAQLRITQPIYSGGPTRPPANKAR